MKKIKLKSLSLRMQFFWTTTSWDLNPFSNKTVRSSFVRPPLSMQTTLWFLILVKHFTNPMWRATLTSSSALKATLTDHKFLKKMSAAQVTTKLSLLNLLCLHHLFLKVPWQIASWCNNRSRREEDELMRRSLKQISRFPQPRNAERSSEVSLEFSRRSLTCYHSLSPSTFNPRPASSDTSQFKSPEERSSMKLAPLKICQKNRAWWAFSATSSTRTWYPSSCITKLWISLFKMLKAKLKVNLRQEMLFNQWSLPFDHFCKSLLLSKRIDSFNEDFYISLINLWTYP